jgi:FMN phosphatase YigB (HAD superfamily)
MMPSPIVIFDAGNVLIRYEPGEALRRLAHAARCSRWRVRLAFTLAGGGRLGTGGISPEEFAAAFGQRLGVHLTPMRVQQFWGLDLKGPVEGMFDLIERLRRRGQARIAILSDTNAFHWGHCLERWPELRRIPDQFVSYETGLRKPDPRVYRWWKSACVEAATAKRKSLWTLSKIIRWLDVSSKILSQVFEWACIRRK